MSTYRKKPNKKYPCKSGTRNLETEGQSKERLCLFILQWACKILNVGITYLVPSFQVFWGVFCFFPFVFLNRFWVNSFAETWRHDTPCSNSPECPNQSVFLTFRLFLTLQTYSYSAGAGNPWLCALFRAPGIGSPCCSYKTLLGFCSGFKEPSSPLLAFLLWAEKDPGIEAWRSAQECVTLSTLPGPFPDGPLLS